MSRGLAPVRPPAGSAAPVAPRPPDGAAAPPGSRLLAVLAVVSLGFVALYLFVALRRMGHPFELEWMEGGVLGHVDRVRQGQALYVAPSVSFVPYLYTPLYYVVGAGATAVFGDRLFSLRLVSFVASLALFGALAVLTRRDSRDRWTPLLAVGLFAACFRISGAWLDLAREDTLCLALLFAGAALVRGVTADRPRRGAVATVVVAATLLALACLTKQVALLPAIAAAGYLACRAGRRLAGWYAAVLVTIGGLSTLVLQLVSHGWYLRYVAVLPSRHEVVAREAAGFFTNDLLAAFAIGTALAGVGLWSRWHGDRDGFWFHALVGGAILAAAWLARLHSGGYDNVLLPAYAELAVLAALGVQHLLRVAPPVGRVVVAVAVLAQLGLLVYNPDAQVPTPADRRAGEQMLAALAQLPRPVYLPGHPWYATETGSPPTAQSAAIEDVLRAPGDGTDQLLARDLSDAVAQRRFGAIVVDSGWGLSYLPDDLCRYYRPDHQLLPTDADPLALPVTGTRTRPSMVWLPRADEGRDCSAGGGSPGDAPPS